MRLDNAPDSWEERTILFCAHLIEEGRQSATIKSYVSAIKYMLKTLDGYRWCDDQVLITILTRACKLTNDRVHVHRLITKNLLEVIIFEVGQLFSQKHYLLVLYRAFFTLLYYGMLRIGELVAGDHPVKAVNVHVVQNKNKMLFVLFTSKTHDLSTHPQKIKIESQRQLCHFCPFRLTKEYLELRGDYKQESEQFFIFRDRTPVKSAMV